MFLFSLCLTLRSLFYLAHSSLIFHLAVKNCMQQFLPQMTTTTMMMMWMWMRMRMANKHAKFSASAFVVVNVPHPTTTAASPYFLLLSLPLCCPPRTLAGSTLSLFIEHIANMFGHFLYCRLATACLAAFLFCVLCCLGLFSLSLFLPLFHSVFLLHALMHFSC